MINKCPLKALEWDFNVRRLLSLWYKKSDCNRKTAKLVIKVSILVYFSIKNKSGFDPVLFQNLSFSSAVFFSRWETNDDLTTERFDPENLFADSGSDWSSINSTPVSFPLNSNLFKLGHILK